METSTEAAFEEQHSLQRSTMLRVYNYYRILISFLFMFLFIDKNFGEFVGAVNPALFRPDQLIACSGEFALDPIALVKFQSHGLHPIGYSLRELEHS